MLPEGNDFKNGFVISEYCKYHIAYPYKKQPYFELGFESPFLGVVLTKNWIFSFPITGDTDAVRLTCELPVTSIAKLRLNILNLGAFKIYRIALLLDPRPK